MLSATSFCPFLAKDGGRVKWPWQKATKKRPNNSFILGSQVFFIGCQEIHFIFSFFLLFCNSKNPCSTSAELTTTSAELCKKVSKIDLEPRFYYVLQKTQNQFLFEITLLLCKNSKMKLITIFVLENIIFEC